MLFAGNGTIKISLCEFFSLAFELLNETCYIYNSRLVEMVQQGREGEGCVCMCAFV